MPRYWTRWYEPKPDVAAIAKAALMETFAEDTSEMILDCLTDASIELQYGYWIVPEQAHRVKYWISGEDAMGEYCVVCAVFDAPDEATVAREIGDRQSVDIDEKPDDWKPGDRFPMD